MSKIVIFDDFLGEECGEVFFSQKIDLFSKNFQTREDWEYKIFFVIVDTYQKGINFAYGPL